MIKGILAMLVVGLTAVASGQAVTLEEIMAHNIEARGGKDLITKVSSMKIVGSMETMGGEMKFTQYLKDNSKLRMEMSVQGMEIIQAFDGIVGWSVNPMSGGEAQRSSEAETKQTRGQANMWGTFVNPEDQGLTLSYVGAEDIDGMTAYVVDITDADGTKSKVYVDAITWLEVKMTRTIAMMGQETEMDIFLSNYKNIGGFQIPMEMTFEMDGQEVMSMKRETVEVNVAIDDQIFAFPG